MSAPPSTPPDAHVSVQLSWRAGERDPLPDGWLAATLLTRIASPQPEERWKPDDRSGALIALAKEHNELQRPAWPWLAGASIDRTDPSTRTVMSFWFVC